MVELRNCGESESDKAIEYSEELNCFYVRPSPTYLLPSPTSVPPSPPYFPWYSSPSPPPPSSSNSSFTYVWDGFEIFVSRNDWDGFDLPDFRSALLVEYKIQDRGGALDVIPSGRLVKINEFVQRLDDFVDSDAKYLALAYADFAQESEPLEKQNEDIIDQLVLDSVSVAQFLIQDRDGAIDSNLLGNFSRTDGISEGQLLPSTPEPGLIFQTNLSLRVWRGHRGQWVVDIRYGWNWLNTGTLKTAEGSLFSSEWVLRFRGGKDLFDLFELFVNENRAEPTTKPRTEIQMLELSPTEEQENPNEDDGVEAEATENDGVEAVGIGGCNGCEGTPIEEVIQSTLKYACREYGIHIWPPHTNTTPMLVDQEEVPPLNSDTLPSDQALPPPLILPTARQENQDKDLGNDEVEVAGIMGEAEATRNDGVEAVGIGPWNGCDSTPIQAIVDTNSVLAKEITLPQSSPAAQQENPDEDFVNGQVEQVGILSEGTEEAENEEPQLNSGPSGKRKRKEKHTSERRNKKTNGVRNVIPLEEISEITEMHLKDDVRHLNVSQSTLKRACREYGINKWPTRNEPKHLRQSLPNKTPAVVNQEGIPQLTFDTLPFDNPMTATVNTNTVIEEFPPPQFSPAARQENLEEDFSNNELEAVGSVGTGEGEMNEAQLNSECLGNGKSNEMTPEEERSNNKTARVRIAIALEDILQAKEMLLTDAAKHLKVNRSKLKSSCREYGIHRWSPRDEHKLVRQSLPDEITPIVDQDGIPQLISNCVTSNQPLMATAKTNSVVKEIPAPWISPTTRQENRNENFATDEIEVIGMRGVGTGEGEMEVDQLNYGCSGKRKTIEKTLRGERGNNKTTGVRIAIPLEDILRTKEMRLKDAAKHLNVSRSTLKRACRDYKIYRWPPRGELKLLSQYSLPNKSPMVVDQGQIPQLNDDTLLPSNQVPTTVNTNSTVTVKARCGKETIKFRLSWPWGTVELKQQVKKRLKLEDETYYIRYKDEDGELILLACDDDLQDCVSSSSPLASKSIEILLEPK